MDGAGAHVCWSIHHIARGRDHLHITYMYGRVLYSPLKIHVGCAVCTDVRGEGRHFFFCKRRQSHTFLSLLIECSCRFMFYTAHSCKLTPRWQQEGPHIHIYFSTVKNYLERLLSHTQAPKLHMGNKCTIAVLRSPTTHNATAICVSA